MESLVRNQQAHPNTVLHCQNGFYRLGYTKIQLAHIYDKDVKTIRNWIHVYETTGTYERANNAADRKFTSVHRQWLVAFYDQKPLAYLEEARAAFRQAHRIEISKSSVWRLIHEAGLTWKVLERRAMHIKERDVFRFIEELSHINWCHANLVFLDEASFDNRGMIRKKGYSMKGKALAIRGDFQRKPRISILAFLGVFGVLDLYSTEGTFDRTKFFGNCRDFAYSENGGVRQYPGPNSVWILDGATIHRHPDIVHFLRSIGLVIIFLPAYCPFFNPIEYLFGYVKRALQKNYDKASSRDLLPFVLETFRKYEKFSMDKTFSHCGWKVDGVFDPTGPMEKERNSTTKAGTEDDFGFRVREDAAASDI